jgi:ElaB/YqjD/DUF883 family membrane-anchored ribosome-binding protein
MANEDPMGQGSSIPPQMGKEADRGVGHTRKASADFGSSAGAIARDYRGKGEQIWDDARDRVRTFQRDADEYVRKNPTKAVFTALGIGFVLGLMFRH